MSHLGSIWPTLRQKLTSLWWSNVLFGWGKVTRSPLGRLLRRASTKASVLLFMKFHWNIDDGVLKHYKELGIFNISGLSISGDSEIGMRLANMAKMSLLSLHGVLGHGELCVCREYSSGEFTLTSCSCSCSSARAPDHRVVCCRHGWNRLFDLINIIRLFLEIDTGGDVGGFEYWWISHYSPERFFVIYVWITCQKSWIWTMELCVNVKTQVEVETPFCRRICWDFFFKPKRLNGKTDFRQFKC